MRSFIKFHSVSLSKPISENNFKRMKTSESEYVKGEKSVKESWKKIKERKISRRFQLFMAIEHEIIRYQFNVQ